MAVFVEVLIPLSVSEVYTYKVPPHFESEVAVGKRVIVSFGQKKLYTGLIASIKTNHEFKELKPILNVLDEKPLVSVLHLAFWNWMHEYYQCTMGEIMFSALPSGIRFDSETLFSANPSANFDTQQFSAIENELMLCLQQKSLTLKELTDLYPHQKVYPVLQQMLKSGYVFSDEVIKNPERKKIKKYYRLNEIWKDEQVHTFLNHTEKRAPKQWEVLSEILHLSETEGIVSEEQIKNKISNALPAIKQLLSKQWITVIEKEVSRINFNQPQSETDIILTYPQKKAFESLEHQLLNHDTVLLHGVTGSGKTHVYIQMIEKMLAQKMQTLYLLPEIALTGQIIKKLQAYFGEKVGIFHSKFNTQERIEIWNKVHQEAYGVVLGARSSLFLPFKHLGLVIIDEEHDGSYKQHDPAPRYHARDAAIMLAKLMDAKVILGSATPSLETYKNVLDKKYGLVAMKERFLNAALPQTQILNTHEALKKKKMKGLFSDVLIEKMKTVLAKNEQVILFHNRRGFAPYLSCFDCQESPKCKYCDVSLTYHQYINKIKCHLCGYTEAVISKCKNCSSSDIRMVGAGTEKIEEEIKILFPEVKVDRLDLETAKGKEAHLKIIEKFETQQTQILIGTQMVTKGLDFDHVSLVGIINADLLLQYPDFRSAERTFQLIAQVSGRAGRKNTKGEVIIQSARPSHPVIQMAAQNDYDSFYLMEMEQRKAFFFPPFSRLIKITLKHKQPDILLQATDFFMKHFRLPMGVKMLGPSTPVISKVKNYYLKEILLKIPKNKICIELSKQNISETVKSMKQQSLLRMTVISLNVDVY